MKRITIYSWGYFGWGNCAYKFVEAVDALEKQRGFAPPLFVDVRIRRTVRARDFQNNHFRDIVGEDRYNWMPGLGNKYILRKRKRGIEIANPEDVQELLNLAIKAARNTQHIIFFCGCQFPRDNGEIACHRVSVGDLLLEAATERKVNIEVVEWPGESEFNFTFSMNSVKEMLQFARTKRVQVESNPVDGLTFGSVIDVKYKNIHQQHISLQVAWKKKRWLLPVMDSEDLRERIAALYQLEAERIRLDYGYAPRRNLLENKNSSKTGHEFQFAGKAISVREPWASAIVFGGKDIENRSKRTHYRGPVAIHASSNSWMEDLEETTQQTVNSPVRSVREWIAQGQKNYGMKADSVQIHPGCIVGIGMLIDCVAESESPWHGHNKWGYRIVGLIPIEPVPMDGNLGLWKCRFKYRPLLPNTD